MLRAKSARIKRVLFGTSKPPGWFQAEIEKVLKDINGVKVFFDDIKIVASSLEEHNLILNEVLQCLEDAGLTVREEKCEFAKNKIQFLGYEIDENGLHVSQDKIKAIDEMKVPENLTELRSFLGMINYYSRFIKNYSTLVSPMYRLLRKSF